MTYEIRIRHLAERDLEKLYAWYDNQAAGLGGRLVRELDNAFSILEDSPKIYADIYNGTRRAILRKFPVGVFYKVQDQVVQVIAVRHLASDQNIWQLRS